MNTDYLREEYAYCPEIQEQIPEGMKGYTIKDEDCEKFLRQITIFYHYVHYLLDRPFLKGGEWPKYLDRLKKDLESALDGGQIPAEWLNDLFLTPVDSDEDGKRYGKYESSLNPLFAATRDKAKTILGSLEKIESEGLRFSKRSDQNVFYQVELEKIRDWALQKSWEVARILGFHNI